MRIPRIYQPLPLASGQRLELDEDGLNHAVRVLRLKAGAPLILFNGEGGEFEATLVEAERRHAVVEVGAHTPVETESPLEITLIQGISRGERMDYTVQKAVELGVTRIVPVIAARTVVNLNGERREKRRQRWQTQAIAACEQCGRNRIPTIEAIVDLTACLAASDSAHKWLLDHRAEAGELPGSSPPTKATLLVGPEGGLTGREQEQAMANGYRGLRLGPRVLRTETAAVVALTVLQSRWGDLG